MDEKKKFVVKKDAEKEAYHAVEAKDLDEPIKEESIPENKSFAKVVVNDAPIKSVITIRPGKTVAVLSFGNIVSVIRDDSIPEGWAKVDFNGLTGFIQKRYISEQK